MLSGGKPPRKKELWVGKTGDARSQSETGRYQVSDMAGVEVLQGDCGPSCPPALSLAVFRVMQEEGLRRGGPPAGSVSVTLLCPPAAGTWPGSPEPTSLLSLPRAQDSCRQE